MAHATLPWPKNSRRAAEKKEHHLTMNVKDGREGYSKKENKKNTHRQGKCILHQGPVRRHRSDESNFSSYNIPHNRPGPRRSYAHVSGKRRNGHQPTTERTHSKGYRHHKRRIKDLRKLASASHDFFPNNRSKSPSLTAGVASCFFVSSLSSSPDKPRR